MSYIKRSICVVTGTRAEYGILRGLLSKIKDDMSLNLQLIVTGTHLSPEFGSTYLEIERDGFEIDRKIEILLSSDTSSAVAKSMGLGLIGFADAISELNPDMIVLLGDRYEILCAASAAMVLRVPIAHIHGGESTEGLIDEAIRHSVTKMAHLHFPAAEVYKNRIIQLGEAPVRVFNFGAMAVDNIKNKDFQSRSDFESSIGMELLEKSLLVTYHPVTLESVSVDERFSYLLFALGELEKTSIIFTKSNGDMGGRRINQLIDDFVKNNRKRAKSFSSLGQELYFSALSHVDGVVGNSSSGIIEAPYIPVGTINIGDRQRGRVAVSSIIQCGHGLEDIRRALSCLFSNEFRETLQKVKPVYGDGQATEKIFQVLKTQDLSNVLKKPFFDIEDIQ